MALANDILEGCSLSHSTSEIPMKQHMGNIINYSSLFLSVWVIISVLVHMLMARWSTSESVMKANGWVYAYIVKHLKKIGINFG